ncbi:hypothetical protein [Streptosporangium roseum]|uniref:hypothetical protein n=1 Tax=Streptosporangium roseum TaxID=2001 RepID=UPI0018CC635D|nr:hypothetical protein [Streptosporangium roseum]
MTCNGSRIGGVPSAGIGWIPERRSSSGCQCAEAQRTHDIPSIGRKAVGDHAQTSEPATKTRS